MTTTKTTAKLVLLTILFAGASAEAAKHCTTRAIAGQWLFATGIGRQALGDPFPSGKDITAIGTMRIDRDGRIEGRFDATVEDGMFLPGNTYEGRITLNEDCTGELRFVTGEGAERTDSIVVVGKGEILGMSRDPNNLWTYQARRIATR